MGSKQVKIDLEQRRKKHWENFSNYENAVTLVGSLESWFEYRWGAKGKEKPGLLDFFDRFPDVDGLTPDFEVRFHTPYILWGEHKRTIQPFEKSRDAADQIVRYAARRPLTVQQSAAQRSIRKGPAGRSVVPNYDVMVIVNTENDDIAAKAIQDAKKSFLNQPHPDGEEAPALAPIIVLGCHLDNESIRGEWYKLKWRNQYQNERFSTPNISNDSAFPDLNKLIVDKSHHAIPVNKFALVEVGRQPFMNDDPPPLYTAMVLLAPCINRLLTDEERDRLQQSGKVEKTVCKNNILGTDIVTSMKRQPTGLGKWVEAALEFMAKDLGAARRKPNTTPEEYVVTVDKKFLKGDLRELWAERAATKAAKQHAKAGRGKRSLPGVSNQLRMFE